MKKHSILLIGLLAIMSNLVTASNRVPPLPSGAVNIIKHHNRAETARLKGVSVEKTQRYALKGANRIAGYPVLGKLATINPHNSSRLAKLLLDENNYIHVLRRCKNHSFHGIRFSQRKQKVELYLGIACNQVGIVFQDNNKIIWWGSVLGNSVTKEVLSILENSQ